MAIIYLAEREINDKDIDFQKSMGVAINNWWHLFYTNLLFLIAIILGIVAFVIPGIIAIVWFFFVTEVVVLKKITGVNALKYSKEMVDGRWFEVGGYILGLVIISLIVGFIAYYPADFFGFIGPVNVLLTTAGDFVVSIFVIFHALMFINFDANRFKKVSGTKS